MKTIEQVEDMERLKENGRKTYDRMQKNLAWMISRTDDDITTSPNPLAEMFGGGLDQNDPEEYRESARRKQDQLDRQGRESFAAEYTDTEIKNYTRE